MKKRLLEELKLVHRKDNEIITLLENYENAKTVKPKESMEQLFAYNKVLKSGALSKLKVMPTTEEMHTKEEYIEKWVEYAALDAELTWYLREVLATELKSLPISAEDMTNSWEFYLKYWIPFGELLTDLERKGIAVSVPHLQKIEQEA